jgi:phage shock protein A
MENNLSGMKAAEAKEYIFGFITTLKLTEKEIHSLEGEAVKWKNRVELARSWGKDDLLKGAEKEAESVSEKLAILREEEHSLKRQITAMRGQLPGLAARERSIDADLKTAAGLCCGTVQLCPCLPWFLVFLAL